MSGERWRELINDLPARLKLLAIGLWGQLLHKLPLKLGAFLLAVIFWVFVSTSDTLLVQRTLRAPLHTEGLGATQTVLGLPERVAVRLSGPPGRLSALNPDGLDAVLNLRGVDGSFSRAVRVFPPQGLTVVWVNPDEIVSTVETRTRKEVPVQVVTLGALAADTVLETQPAPTTVQVEGGQGQLEQVTQVLAPYDPAAPTDNSESVSTENTGTENIEAENASTENATVKVYAANARGEPVSGVTVIPAQVGVSAESRSVLAVRILPLELTPVTAAGLEVVSATLTRENVTVVGPETALAALEGVAATLPETSVLRPGQYTLALTLELPDGVSALGAPQLELRVRTAARE